MGYDGPFPFPVLLLSVSDLPSLLTLFFSSSKAVWLLQMQLPPAESNLSFPSLLHPRHLLNLFLEKYSYSGRSFFWVVVLFKWSQVSIPPQNSISIAPDIFNIVPPLCKCSYCPNTRSCMAVLSWPTSLSICQYLFLTVLWEVPGTHIGLFMSTPWSNSYWTGSETKHPSLLFCAEKRKCASTNSQLPWEQFPSKYILP